MPRTLDEIRRHGLEALRRKLGRTGLVRFMQQFTTGEGDYTRLRQEWVDRLSLDELRELANVEAPPAPKRPKVRPQPGR
jgi:hypothetical protein